MYRYIRSSTQEYPDTFKVGDKITVNLISYGAKTATCVQVLGRRNTQYMFVFDGCVGKSNMNNIDIFLDKLYNKFPKDLANRLQLIRLLQASEVFSSCDTVSAWDWLLSCGVDIENVQIDYFKSEAHRIPDTLPKGPYIDSWLLSTELPSLSEKHSIPCFAGVNESGYSVYILADKFQGVRPAFILS